MVQSCELKKCSEFSDLSLIGGHSITHIACDVTYNKYQLGVVYAGVPLGINDRSLASISMPFSSPIEKGIDKASI